MSTDAADEPMSAAKKLLIALAIATVLPWVFLFLVISMAANLLPGGDDDSKQKVPPEVSCVKVAGIPKPTCEAYLSAEIKIKTVRPKCTNLRWTLLAGIGKIESNHGQYAGAKVIDKYGKEYGNVVPPVIGIPLNGREGTALIYDTDDGKYDNDTVYDRAVGPTQFIPQTWESVAQDGDEDGDTDPQNVFDSALTTAAYLCGTGEADFSDKKVEHDAILRYNHSEKYVSDVLAAKAEYDALGDVSGPIDASEKAQKVIAAARKHKGVDYSWGGGDAHGPSYGICCSPGGHDGRKTFGFDCSGLTEYAYAQVSLMIGSTAQAQHDSGKVRVTSSPGSLAGAKPGDLLFFSDNPGSGKGLHHVSIYLGKNMQIEAPRTGDVVKESPVRSNELDSIGHLE
ncbi:NlpC/P60 family protein [Streptomyces sp. NBC_01210]|uniref:C40 family peptidase n=1 Tax=Streptomyces sp. NBC_01210 TaxID=2903774 RepID=UPI002E0F90BF|nr:NlpC/P60 family protein [Streptomyces sp. NBC_01210]